MQSNLSENQILTIIDLSNWVFRITGYQTEARLNERWDIIEKTTRLLTAISAQISKLAINRECISNLEFRKQLVDELFNSNPEKIDKFLDLLDASNKGTYHDFFHKGY